VHAHQASLITEQKTCSISKLDKLIRPTTRLGELHFARNGVSEPLGMVAVNLGDIFSPGVCLRKSLFNEHHQLLTLTATICRQHSYSEGLSFAPVD
jgi:hypothetical protein